MKTATGSRNVTLIPGGKSVIVDNDQPLVPRAGKTFDDQGRYILQPGGGDGSNLIGPGGIGKKRIAAFLGIGRNDEDRADQVGRIVRGRRRSLDGKRHQYS